MFSDIPALATPLNEFELRVMGVLVEKNYSTPDYYPMSVNAIVLGCNQKNNRFPVVAYTERDVENALESLSLRRLVSIVREHGARVPKYMQLMLREIARLERPELALLAVMMLRGPQTLGELKTRTESMHRFENLQACERALQNLLDYKPEPLALRLERAAGERETRYAQMLAGEISAARANVSLQPRTELEGRVEALEAEVRELRNELDAIKTKLV